MVISLTKPTTTTTTTTIKFLCSYGGKIVPRHPDGKLRYHGGETRVLAVDRSISFSELLLKLRELMMCGTTTTIATTTTTSLSVSVRCQLPTEDLDALVSITCDEDLANLIEEYDKASPPPPPPPSSSSSSSLKIRAFLSLPKKAISPPTYPSSPASSSSSSSNNHFTTTATTTPRYSVAACLRPVAFAKPAGKIANTNHQQQHHHHHHHHQPHHRHHHHHHHGYYVHGNPSNNVYLIHNGNHWQ